MWFINNSKLKIFKEAEEAAKILGNKLYIAVANRMIGETLCALGEFEEAVQHQKVHLSMLAFLFIYNLCN